MSAHTQGKPVTAGALVEMTDNELLDAVEANARLIAAAPDLLAALERSLNWLSSYPGGCAEGCYDQARAAIAKATGETQ